MANVREVQAPLRARYKADPSTAVVIDRARSAVYEVADPFHAAVVPQGSVSAHTKPHRFARAKGPEKSSGPLAAPVAIAFLVLSCPARRTAAQRPTHGAGPGRAKAVSRCPCLDGTVGQSARRLHAC